VRVSRAPGNSHVTAIFTLAQVHAVPAALNQYAAIVSVFAGRIAVPASILPRTMQMCNWLSSLPAKGSTLWG